MTFVHVGRQGCDCFKFFFAAKWRVGISQQIMYFFCYSVRNHKTLNPVLSTWQHSTMKHIQRVVRLLFLFLGSWEAEVDIHHACAYQLLKLSRSLTLLVEQAVFLQRASKLIRPSQINNAENPWLFHMILWELYKKNNCNDLWLFNFCSFISYFLQSKNAVLVRF